MRGQSRYGKLTGHQMSGAAGRLLGSYQMDMQTCPFGDCHKGS